MIRLFAIVAFASILSGCFGPITMPESEDKSFYVIDLKTHALCRGMTNDCFDMNTIVYNMSLVQPIENRYNKTITGPNYRGSLIKMMIFPPDESYTAEKMTSNGRYYRLPINDKTDSVWFTLKELDRRHNFKD